MTCWTVKRRINDYVDKRLRGNDLASLEAHLAECRECELQTVDHRSVRSSLSNLPNREVPSDLRLRLRVRASHERKALLETNGSHWLTVWNGWKFRMNALMRPLTIPATGGLLSSFVLFGALAFTISTSTRIVAYDVPVDYESSHIDANLVPMELRSSVVVTLSTDGNGRITDYAYRDESRSVIGDTGRLQPNLISLPDIPTVMRVAQPMSSDIRISFTPIFFRP